MKLATNHPVLVTGAAGFIGFHVSRALLESGNAVIGFDSVNDYYDVSLKEGRLNILSAYPDFHFVKGNLADEKALDELFFENRFEYVIHLAAQAGVRYSIDHPDAYLESNLTGFFRMLEKVRKHPVRHFVYASSSSVYGNRKEVPFKAADMTDSPISLYAATKKSNELLAYAYSHLYSIPATGLRFFTVYGPWGRPDMAYFKFTKKILNGEPIEIYNNGDLYRDFTYIDDIVKGILDLTALPPEEKNGAMHEVYNIGNNAPENLLHFVEVLENTIGKKAEKILLPMQAGDVYQTFADVEPLKKKCGFFPETPIEKGLSAFWNWYKDFYHTDGGSCK